MKEYAKQPENVSRAFDKQPRASRQASISDILQRYKSGSTRESVQFKRIEDRDLLSNVYAERETASNINSNQTIQRMKIVQLGTEITQDFLFIGNQQVMSYIDQKFEESARNFRTDPSKIGQPLAPPERLAFAGSIIEEILNKLYELYGNESYFISDYDEDPQVISEYITGRDVPMTPDDVESFRHRLSLIHGNPFSSGSQGGRFIGVLDKWHLHIEIGTNSHLTFNTSFHARKSLNTPADLITAATEIFGVNNNGGPECYAWIRSEYIFRTNQDLPPGIRR